MPIACVPMEVAHQKMCHIHITSSFVCCVLSFNRIGTPGGKGAGCRCFYE